MRAEVLKCALDACVSFCEAEPRGVLKSPTTTSGTGNPTLAKSRRRITPSSSGSSTAGLLNLVLGGFAAAANATSSTHSAAKSRVGMRRPPACIGGRKAVRIAPEERASCPVPVPVPVLFASACADCNRAPYLL